VPHESEEEDEEEEDEPLNLYEFLEDLDAEQAGEGPPAELQAIIAASFET
jgi:hypothetical protein